MRKSKNSSKGFYIALGVCLIAIGVAAWTTYDSVVNYANPDDSQSTGSTQQVGEQVSGVTETPSSKIEVITPSETPSSKAESSSQQSSSSQPAKTTLAQSQTPTYSYPVGKTVSLEFSGDELIYSKTLKDWRAHTGVDFAAKAGDEVKSISSGTVTNVYQDDLLGKVIVVDHSGIEAYYCGMDEVSVQKGAKVQAGQKVGTVGELPCECEDDSHFHLSVKRDGKFIDPLSILK